MDLSTHVQQRYLDWAQPRCSIENASSGKAIRQVIKAHTRLDTVCEMIAATRQSWPTTHDGVADRGRAALSAINPAAQR
jgi:hypothetical protein